MGSWSVSAPAKLILFGEHAVVYGKLAVAASLNLRTVVESSPPTDANLVNVHRPNLQTDLSWSLEQLNQLHQRCISSGWLHNDDPHSCSSEMKEALFSFCNQDKGAVAFLYLYFAVSYPHAPTPLSLKIQSEVPVGAGLGSSAAYSVSLAGLLLLLNGRLRNSAGREDNQPESDVSWTPDHDDQVLICSWALQAERIMHGDGASGIDNTISTFGGAIGYRKGTPMTLIEKMPSLNVLITDTRVSRDTKLLVESVRRRYNDFPDMMEHIMEAIHNISQDSISTFTGETCPAKMHHRISTLVDMNHQLLCALGVGHSSLDRVVKLANRKGFPTKLTGAGGGGCAFSLVPSDKEEVGNVIEQLEKKGYRCITSKLGGQGVTFSKLT